MTSVTPTLDHDWLSSSPELVLRLVPPEPSVNHLYSLVPYPSSKENSKVLFSSTGQCHRLGLRPSLSLIYFILGVDSGSYSRNRVPLSSQDLLFFPSSKPFSTTSPLYFSVSTWTPLSGPRTGYVVREVSWRPSLTREGNGRSLCNEREGREREGSDGGSRCRHENKRKTLDVSIILESRESDVSSFT